MSASPARAPERATSAANARRLRLGVGPEVEFECGAIIEANAVESARCSEAEFHLERP